VLSFGCGPRGSGTPVWLAHIATLSGPDKQAGESAARGIRLAVKEFNDNEQALGHPLKVIHSDTHGKLEAFEAEATRLVAVNRISFLLGGSTPAEVEQLDHARATVLTPCGARPRGVSDAVYFTGLTPLQQGKALARFIAQESRVESALLVEDDRGEEASLVAEALVRELPLAAAKDGKATALDRLRLAKDVKPGEFAKQLDERLKESAAKVIVFAGRAEDLQRLGAVARPVLFAGAEGVASTVQQQRHDFKEVYWVTAFVSDADTSRAKEFRARFKSAFQEEADVHAALAYENLRLLYEAMVRTKDSLSVQRIREELGQTKDYAGLTGPLSFTPERQLRRQAFVVRWEAGAAKTVKRYEPD
jgi:ABC-type branched-subunit amino acid transport system substrate-binding protein